MKRHSTVFFVAVSASLLVSGCAGDSDRFPSLAIRDAERSAGQFTPVAAETVHPIRPVASSTDLSALLTRAQTANTAFSTARLRADQLVSGARGRSIDSNARQIALVALADLATLRSDTALAAGDLDLLKAEAATTFAPTDDVDAVRLQVSALLEEQDEALDALWGKLNS